MIERALSATQLHPAEEAEDRRIAEHESREPRPARCFLKCTQSAENSAILLHCAALHIHGIPRVIAERWFAIWPGLPKHAQEEGLANPNPIQA